MTAPGLEERISRLEAQLEALGNGQELARLKAWMEFSLEEIRGIKADLAALRRDVLLLVGSLSVLIPLLTTVLSRLLSSPK